MPYYYYYGYGDMYLFWALLAVMVLGFVAQIKVKNTFERYSKQPAQTQYRACDVAARILRQNNSMVTIKPVHGQLTDHFDPRSNTVGLSQDVYDSNSVAALAVAMHEIGHVMQYENDYLPIRVRNAILPVANFGSQAAPFIVLLGLLMSNYTLAMAGVILFGAMFLFQVVTLPVEFNASRRALSMLTEGGYLTREEIPQAKKVLNAAAMTYVVGALASLVSLLRLLAIAGRTKRD